MPRVNLQGDSSAYGPPGFDVHSEWPYFVSHELLNLLVLQHGQELAWS